MTADTSFISLSSHCFFFSCSKLAVLTDIAALFFLAVHSLVGTAGDVVHIHLAVAFRHRDDAAAEALGIDRFALFHRGLLMGHLGGQDGINFCLMLAC